jgi:hypothetical protein
MGLRAGEIAETPGKYVDILYTFPRPAVPDVLKHG